ncbi:MAG: hypothetical protein SVR08_15455 [Spirochaetota bacterium]|nr:hypothetical protein [Spirochaetota bacterium]
MKSIEDLKESLRHKEVQAKNAKKNGMHTTYSNLLSEISDLKRKIDQKTMGSQSDRNFTNAKVI